MTRPGEMLVDRSDDRYKESDDGFRVNSSSERDMQAS